MPSSTSLRRTFAFVALLGVVSLFQSQVYAIETIVEVEQGLLTGTVLELSPTSTIARFYGVPFAAAPVGPLRFMPPQPPTRYSNVYNGTYPRALCMQSPPGGVQLLVSEDCLYLNIWAPMQNISQSLNSSSAKLPVMLFIHGGSFNSGSGVVYDSTALAQTGNVITITINYRLGAFGFLAAAPLQAANSLNTTGNYGLQDQRAALQWVQKNIAQFGGDPMRVTVFGESAGAISICHHLVSPHSAGLFSSVLLESGLCDARNMSFALTNSTSHFLTAINCSANEFLLTCLANRTSQEIFNAQRKVPSSAATGFLPWGPVIDGYELVKPPQEYLGNGTFSRVPVLLGTNLNEYSYFLCGRQSINISKEGAIEFLVGIFGKHRADEAIRLYDFQKYSSPVQLMIDVMSDFIFKCPSRLLANVFFDSGLPVYMYSFEHVPGWSALQGPCRGVSHADEIPFVFPATLPLLAGTYQFTPAEKSLSMAFMTSWAHFAASRNPTNPLASWVPWSSETPYTIMNLNITSGKHFRREKCEFWAGEYKPAGPLHWGIWVVIGVGSTAILGGGIYLVWRYINYRNHYTRLEA